MFHPALSETSDRQSTRREFFQHTVVGSLVCSLAASWQGLLGAEQQAAARYDLLVKGGKVVDPSQKLSSPRRGHRLPADVFPLATTGLTSGAKKHPNWSQRTSGILSGRK